MCFTAITGFALILTGVQHDQQAVLKDKGVFFRETNFETILSDAKELNQIIFFEAYTNWCAPCKKMKKEVLGKESVGQYFNEHFINYRIDIENHPESKKMINRYKINQVPTYLFLDQDGKVLIKTVGYKTKKELLSLAKLVKKKKW